MLNLDFDMIQALRYVVYPSPFVKCALLLSVGKARASESVADTLQGTFFFMNS
jgi:hypothetical protein